MYMYSFDSEQLVVWVDRKMDSVELWYLRKKFPLNNILDIIEKLIALSKK